MPLPEGLAAPSGLGPSEQTRAFWQRRRPWPQTISGLALPNGVFLSDGHAQAGAGPLGLVAAGLGIGLLGLLSLAVTYVVVYALQRLLGAPLVPVYLGTYFARQVPADLWVWEIVVNVTKLLSFLVLMRLSPLAGYHAAEHQVVHGIEMGQELTLDLVKSISPVHRRCGSNLVGPIFVVLALAPLWLPRGIAPGFDRSAWWVGQWPWLLLISPLAWRFRRQTGSFLQKHFLTKKPSEKQLTAGIESGRLLIHLHRLGKAGPLSRWPLWQRGLPQVGLGMILAMSLAWWVNSNLLMWLDF